MIEFYQKEFQRFEEKIKTGKKQILLLAMLRLSFFAGICLAVYLLWGQNLWVVLSIIIGLVVFMQLVIRHSQKKKQVDYFKARKTINDTEIDVSKGDFNNINNGAKYIHPRHPFNQDIDLFGNGSLFQRINRTSSEQGEQFLADWFNKNSIQEVSEKQKSIQELSKKTEWRHHFIALSQLNKEKNILPHQIKWMKNYKPFLPNWILYLVIGFSLASIGMITAYSLGYLTIIQLLYWLLFGMFIVGLRVKKTTALYNTVVKFKDAIGQYSELTLAIENEKFETSILQNLKNQIKTDNGKTASIELKKLARYSEGLGNRNNILMSPIINGFFLWDYYYGLKIEKWICENGTDVSNWLDTVFAFEGLNSLGNYAFNHSEFIYPTIKSGTFHLNSKELGHPLISKNKCTTNDVSIKNEDFFIVTGANMAGKSTFLRTLAMNILMANCGLPVFAQKFEYSPIQLISSMRTTDSLENESSYFHAEISRLKYIIDQLQNNNYFIILDEILKGTNSKDKAEGSAKFLQKLLKTGSTGIIATHDLSLCELENQFSQITNYCFEAKIENDELSFNYKLNKGICQNMNASFLLQKMGIV